MLATARPVCALHDVRTDSSGVGMCQCHDLGVVRPSRRRGHHRPQDLWGLIRSPFVSNNGSSRAARRLFDDARRLTQDRPARRGALRLTQNLQRAFKEQMAPLPNPECHMGRCARQLWRAPLLAALEALRSAKISAIGENIERGGNKPDSAVGGKQATDVAHTRRERTGAV